MSAPPATPQRRTLRRASLLLGLIVLAMIGIPACLGFVTTYTLLHPPCSASPTTPGDYGHTWEAITLTARATGDSIAGYFIPGSGGAAIIIPPPYAGGRGSRLHEADVLARHGYAVLTYDSRRCAGMGALSLGYQEVDEVADALDYLRTRDDIDPGRIGLLGFSSAGATGIMAAARLPEIRAVVAEGGYGDLADGQIGIGDSGDNPLTALYKHTIALSYRLITGDSIDRLSPTDVIGQIAPRPILLIYGSRETSLPGARAQQTAAGANAALWVVEGAGHGNYLETAPDEYEARVIAFFDAALPDAE
ncbi:MAG: hypothetical protein GXY36_07365 [Chloroflexi bacterium]|nr:hypothetical protein [Chloroflexota bacterium]